MRLLDGKQLQNVRVVADCVQYCGTFLFELLLALIARLLFVFAVLLALNLCNFVDFLQFLLELLDLLREQLGFCFFFSSLLPRFFQSLHLIFLMCVFCHGRLSTSRVFVALKQFLCQFHLFDGFVNVRQCLCQLVHCRLL